MSEAIAFFSGLIAMTIVWFVHDTKYNPYMRGYADGLNDGIQEVKLRGEHDGCLIGRQAAIDALAMADARKGWKSLRFSEIQKVLLKLPSEQPNRGKWVRNTKTESVYNIDGLKTCQCSRCTFTAIAVEDFGCYNYCPNCGSDNRGEQDE